MGKYCGVIGYAETQETAPGVWTEEIVERRVIGNVEKLRRGWRDSENLNDDTTVSASISIIDEFMFEKCFLIRYVTLYGARWKVKDIDIQPPRIILTLGGVYNGDEIESSNGS